jgi:hypothetical protein
MSSDFLPPCSIHLAPRKFLMKDEVDLSYVIIIRRTLIPESFNTSYECHFTRLYTYSASISLLTSHIVCICQW